MTAIRPTVGHKWTEVQTDSDPLLMSLWWSAKMLLPHGVEGILCAM